MDLIFPSLVCRRPEACTEEWIQFFPISLWAFGSTFGHLRKSYLPMSLRETGELFNHP